MSTTWRFSSATLSVTLRTKTKALNGANNESNFSFQIFISTHNIYYFRFKLAKHLPQPEISMSLKTKVLADAVFLWQKLIPYTEKLKQLILLGDKVIKIHCALLFQGIKSDMLKQLQINQTDSLIAELEKDYSSLAHMMKASVGNEGIIISDNDRERLLYLLGDRQEESFISRKFGVNEPDIFDDSVQIELAKDLLQCKGFAVDESDMGTTA